MFHALANFVSSFNAKWKGVFLCHIKKNSSVFHTVFNVDPFNAWYLAYFRKREFVLLYLQPCAH